ncbi:MAG: hypothetical protein QW735_00640 [archaeon]
MEVVYKIDEKAVNNVKKIIEAQDRVEEKEGKKTFIVNEWSRKSLSLRDGKILNLEKGFYYLKVEAEPEFFKEHEKEILFEGVKKLEGEELKKALEEFKKEEESSAMGIGAMFSQY